MKMPRWPIALALSGAAALSACADVSPGDDDIAADTGLSRTPADGELDYGYRGWDVNEDRALSPDEFGSWAREQGWRDLDHEGFSRIAHRLWDVDRDDAVSEQEWTEATNRWYGDAVEHGSWAAWDRDRDSELDVGEAHAAFERYDLYSPVDLDGDGVIHRDELAAWWFDVWDFNDDETIDTSEWSWAEQYGYDRIGEPGEPTRQPD